MNRSNRITFFAFGVVALALVAVFILWRNASSVRKVPKVTAKISGYLVDNGGNAVFTVSNASPYIIHLGESVLVQLPREGGWVTTQTSMLGMAWILRPGQTQDVSLGLPAVDEPEWRAEFEVLAHGHYDVPDILQRAAYRAAIETGAEFLKPSQYTFLSEVITNSLSEVAEDLRRRRSLNRKTKSDTD